MEESVVERGGPARLVVRPRRVAVSNVDSGSASSLRARRRPAAGRRPTRGSTRTPSTRRWSREIGRQSSSRRPDASATPAGCHPAWVRDALGPMPGQNVPTFAASKRSHPTPTELLTSRDCFANRRNDSVVFPFRIPLGSLFNYAYLLLFILSLGVFATGLPRRNGNFDPPTAFATHLPRRTDSRALGSIPHPAQARGASTAWSS